MKANQTKVKKKGRTVRAFKRDLSLWLFCVPGVVLTFIFSYIVVTDNAEDPELICRWFDNAFSLENGIGISTGPVGTIVTKEDDGYHVIDKSTLSEEDQEKYSWANLWPQAVSKYMPAGFRLVEENPDYDEKDAVEKIYEPNLTEGVIEENWIDMDSIDTYADISTAIRDYF